MNENERSDFDRPANTETTTVNTAAFQGSAFTQGLDLPPKRQLALPARIQHHHRRFKEWFMGLRRRDKILFCVGVTVVVLLIAGGLAMALRKPAPQAPPVITQHHSAGTPAPTTVASNLTGLQVDPSVNQRPVIGVMVENSKDARPQSGLDQAGVVFEALAEGGVTRFLALFQDNQAGYIGPIRSARPYYIQWCQGFDCDYAHVGGSPDALSDITAWGIRDLNQFAGGSYFSRVSNRAAPHNVYSSIDRLTAFATSRHYAGSSYTGFARLAKDGKADPNQPTAHSINLNFNSSTYDVHYDYDAATNTYKRSEGGAAHTVVDGNGTSTQLAPKVVIAMAIPLSRGALDASGAYYSNYQVVGNGEAEVFQNGTVVHGTWSKPTATSQITFTDNSGAAIKLDPGQTWLSALSSIGDATYN